MDIKRLSFLTSSVVGNQIQVKGSIQTRNEIEYTITDNSTGQSQTANVEVFTLKGTPGLGGFNVSTFGRFSEDGGILAIDLSKLIDPLGNAAAFNISNLRVSNIGFQGPRSNELSYELQGNVVSLDLDQFNNLVSGQNTTLVYSFDTSNGTQTESSSISFVIEGQDDITTTISQADQNGLILGDNSNNTLLSRPNAQDILVGGNGSDSFQFYADYYDGNNDRDIIVDYQQGRDKIDFQPGSKIISVFEVDDGVVLSFDGGMDSLFIFGDDLHLDDLDLSGYEFEKLDTSPGATSLEEQLLLSNLLFIQNSQIIYDFNAYLSGGFSGTFGFPDYSNLF